MAKGKQKPAKQKRKPKAKRATSHSDFAGDGADGGELSTLVADGEAKNAKADKPIPASLIEYHIKQIDDAETARDTANKNAAAKRKLLANKWKNAEVDGLDKAALKRAREIRSRSMAEVVAEERHTREYLIVMEVEIGHQWSMFDSPAVDAKAQGEHAGRNGEHRDTNPHRPGTEARVLWDEGHTIGQSAIAAGIGKSPNGAGETAH